MQEIKSKYLCYIVKTPTKKKQTKGESRYTNVKGFQVLWRAEKKTLAQRDFSRKTQCTVYRAAVLSNLQYRAKT